MPKKSYPNFDKVLIDADILHYRCAAAGDKVTYILRNKDGEVLDEFQSAKECKDFLEMLFDDVPDEDKPIREKVLEVRDLEHCKKAFRNQINSILKATGAKKAVLYLGGDSSKNFRHKIATVKKYKSGRQQEKPTHFEALRKWIIQEYKPIISSGIESDDRLCIDSRKDFEQSKKKRDKMMCRICTATIDKDDYGYPHWLYDYDKMTQPEFITVKAARKSFYKQCLTGDTVDTIPGCKGVGEKTAEKILADCKTDQEYWQKVVETYEKQYKKDVDEDGYVHYKHAYTGEGIKKTPEEIAIEMARLLHMLRAEDEIWEPVV